MTPMLDSVQISLSTPADAGMFDILGVVPLMPGHPGLAAALSRSGAVGVLDLEFAGADTLRPR